MSAEMDFGCETSDHVQDLSECSESVYLDDLSQQSEAQEEPLAKRQRTETTNDIPPRTGEMFREPAWFDCRGNFNSSKLIQMFPQSGYLASGVFSAVSRSKDSYPQFYNKCVIRLFEAKFLTASAFTFHLEKLFFLLRQQVAILENDGNITSFTDDCHSRSLVVRRRCGEFMAYLLHYTHHYLGSIQHNSRNILLSPSTLTKELDELLLYLGRLSGPPSAFVRSEPVSAVSSLRLTSGEHTFHLHLEMTWAAIQAMYSILEAPNHLDKLSSDHHVDTIYSINKATLSLVWDLIATAASLSSKASQSQADVLKVSPFPCGCVCEIWIMLIHLMDHLSTRNYLQSFWSAVSSIMSEILQSKTTVSDSQESGIQSFAPPGFTIRSPATFCWWLLTHLSPLYWVTDKGMYSQRKKGCAPGNWVLVQDLLKVSLQSNKESHEESHRRFCLRCCLSLSCHWSANSDLLLWLWDYFHKRMNDSFHIPGQSLHTIAVVSSSALQWMEQCLNRSKETTECASGLEQESSYNLFLRVVSVHLTKLLQSGSLRAWKQIKGRFYSKFNKRRMEDLNCTGLYQFISLFLTLSCVADLEDASNKMCSLLELLDFDSMPQDKKKCVWKGLFALLLIHKENKVDLGYMAERLSQKFTTVAREYSECSSLDKNHQRNCWQLVSLYLDNTQDVFEHKNKQDLSEAKLLGGGFQWLFHSCRNNELRYLLNFVQTILTSINQRSGKDEETRDAVTAMWQHMFSHVRALMTDIEAMESVSNHVADTLASFTLSSVDRYPDVVKGLPDVSFASLVQELSAQDEVPASFCCRLLCHILPCSLALEAIKRERLEGDIIHTWFRCLVQLSPSHEGLTELTRAVSKLPEMEVISRTQLGFGSGESSERSLQLFVIALGVHFASLDTFDETIQFKQKVQIYLGDVMKYTDHVLRSGGPPDLLRLAYHVAGLLTKHCYKIIYSKTQPKCLLPRLVDQFALPLPNAKKPVSPPVMQCIKTYLHQFLQGLSYLDFKRDEFIRRKIKQVFTTYFRLFNQKCQATPNPGNSPTKNPFLVVLKDSLLPNPRPESSDFRHFVIEVIRESFLCLPQPPVNLTSTLFFLEQLFRRTLSPAETARNTPVILNAITGCLLACNEFTPENEPLDIRRQADEILRMMLIACRKTPQVTSRDILLPHLRDFLYTNMMRNQGLVFRTFETLASFDPDLLVELIPDAKQAVVQSEQKRGVGTDLVLRAAFKSFLNRLGVKGQLATKELEQESQESL